MATLKDSKYFCILLSHAKTTAQQHVTDYKHTLITPQMQNLSRLCQNLVHSEGNVKFNSASSQVFTGIHLLALRN